MSLLGRLFSWGPNNPQLGVSAGGSVSSNPVHWLTSPENSDTWTITPISNGFLLSSRTYNPQGPDKITAHYAANPADLAEAVTTQMTLLRLKK